VRSSHEDRGGLGRKCVDKYGTAPQRDPVRNSRPLFFLKPLSLGRRSVVHPLNCSFFAG